MSIYAKYISEYKISYCPPSGVLKSGKAVSNLNKYFNDNPEIAKENDYYPYEELINVSLDLKEGDITIMKYSFDGSKIYGKRVVEEVINV